MTAPELDRSSNELATFDVSVAGPSATVRAAGEIDSTTAPRFSECLDAVLDSGVRDLTVDLGHVTFLDSAGLCALATAHRRAGHQDARLRVLATSRAVVRPLQITGLWTLLGAEQVADAGQVA